MAVDDPLGLAREIAKELNALKYDDRAKDIESALESFSHQEVLIKLRIHLNLLLRSNLKMSNRLQFKINKLLNHIKDKL